LNEAIVNRDSFLFHEVDGYDAGLIGYHKPLSQAMFGAYQMVESIRNMFDTDLQRSSEWDAIQWEAYSRAVLMTFRSYIEEGNYSYSASLYGAMGEIQRIAFDVHKLNGIDNITWDNDALARVRVAVTFIGNAVEILATKAVPDYLPRRIRKKHGPGHESIYDHLAGMIFEGSLATAAGLHGMALLK
jgi:hypothetical protein